MKTSIVAGSLFAALSLVTPVRAQQVAARVVVRSGPVAGRVVIGDEYSSYRRPVVAYRPVPARVIVVERIDRRRHRRADWRGYRQVVVYYRDGRYYDRYDRYQDRGRYPMREIVVYERGGRYYRDCDDDHGRDDRYDRHASDGRFDRHDHDRDD